MTKQSISQQIKKGISQYAAEKKVRQATSLAEADLVLAGIQKGVHQAQVWGNTSFVLHKINHTEVTFAPTEYVDEWVKYDTESVKIWVRGTTRAILKRLAAAKCCQFAVRRSRSGDGDGAYEVVIDFSSSMEPKPTQSDQATTSDT